MASKEVLAQKLRKSIDNGLNIDMLAMKYQVRKTDILTILQGHYTSVRAQNLWIKSINNQNYSEFVDESIGDRLCFFELHAQLAIYPSILDARYYAKIIRFEITDIVHLNPIKHTYELFDEDTWFIVAEKAENEIGFTFAIFGPDDSGNNMIAMETDYVPKKIINQFLKEAYRYF